MQTSIAKTQDYREDRERVKQIKLLVMEMSYKAHVGHIGSAISIVDLLTVLYFHTLNISKASLRSPDRDRFILSKGHAAAALYAVLYKKGILPQKMLSTFAADEEGLCEHPEIKDPGIEMTTGSLGHGLPFGAGIALGLKKNNSPGRVFILVSDGECGEGSVWEAAIFASKHKLDNLTVILENNGWQCFGNVSDITNLAPFSPKWSSFGWGVVEIDGHNLTEIHTALDELPVIQGKPSIIIAKTRAGKGVSLFENQLSAHCKMLTESEYRLARNELENS